MNDQRRKVLREMEDKRQRDLLRQLEEIEARISKCEANKLRAIRSAGQALAKYKHTAGHGRFKEIGVASWAAALKRIGMSRRDADKTIRMAETAAILGVVPLEPEKRQPKAVA